MTPFQWIFGSGLLCVLLLELAAFVFFRSRSRLRAARILVWCTGLTILLRPDLTNWIANGLRIGRGVDIVLYTMAILFPFAFFYLLGSVEKQRQQTTTLVRELALKTPIPAESENHN